MKIYWINLLKSTMNKQHKYIFKAFLNSSIPVALRKNKPDLIVIDSIIGGYCTQILKKGKIIKTDSDSIISKKDKIEFSELID